MVQRTSERLNLQAGRTPEVAVQGGGGVAPKNTGGIFSNQIATKYPDLVAVPTGQLDPIVQALFKVGGKITDELIQRQQQEAYLNGALALGAGLSEEQLQADPLTRQWARAGYRDAVGRLAIADYEAQTAKDMLTLQEKSPEEMAAYLQAARRKLMPVLERMSPEAKSKLFTQLLTSEQASMAAHTKAHQEFVVNTMMTSLQAGYGAVADKLFNTAGPRDPRYNSALAATASYLGANVWNNPSLPTAAKHKLIEGAIETALSRGDTGLYQWAQNATVPGADGKPSTLWNQLGFKTQTTLAKAYRTALGQNDARMNADWWDRTYRIDTALASGQVPLTYDEYYTHLQAGVAAGSISPTAMSSNLAQYAKATGKLFERSGAINAVLTGDPTYLLKNGITDKKAAEWTVQAIVEDDVKNGRPLGATFDKVSNIAIERGSKEMMAEAAALLEPQINVMMASQAGEVDPNAASVMVQFSNKIDQAVQAGNVAAKENFLALLPEAQQDYMRTYMAVRRKHSKESMSTDSANFGMFLAEETRKLQAWRKDLPPDVARQVRVDQWKEADKAVLDLERTGKLGAIGGVFTGLFSETARNRQKLTKTDRWFFNDNAYREQENVVKNAILDEYRELTRTEFGWEPQDLADKAMANVAARSVRTAYGLAIFPGDVDIKAAFSVPASASLETVGLGLERILESRGADKDLTTSFNVTGNGIMVSQFDDDGAYKFGDTILSKDVGLVVEDILKGEATEYNGVYGSGVVRKGQGGAEVRFNGENSVGIEPKTALRIRNTLVDLEGITDKPYPDGSGGRTSVGVGLNSGGAWYPKAEDFNADGTIKPEASAYYFARASDAAMESANKGISYWRLPENNEPLLTMLTSMAYQGGVAFFTNVKSNYTKFMAELKSGDESSALESLRATPVWRMSPDTRKKWYEDRVLEYFRTK